MNIVKFRIRVSSIFVSDILNVLGNPALLTILGSRMLFNLKEVGERGQNEGTSYRTSTSAMSDIEFTDPANPQRYALTFLVSSAELMIHIQRK